MTRERVLLFFFGGRDFIMLRRFFALLPEFRSLGMKVLLIDAESRMRDEIDRETIRNSALGEFERIPYRRHVDTASVSIPPLASASSCAIKEAMTASRKRNSGPGRSWKSFSALLTEIGVDHDAIARGFLAGYRGDFLREHKTSAMILAQHRPDVVLIDDDFPLRSRGMLLAARDRGIPTALLPHCEGSSEQYRTLPVMADYCVAYGDEHRRTFLSMGAAPERVLLTGSVDTDLLLTLDRREWREHWTRSFGLDPDRELLLIALRPFSFPAYGAMNHELLQACLIARKAAPEMNVILKLHPTDHALAREAIVRDHFADYGACSIADSDVPLSHLLVAADRFVTHLSSSIVEAVMLDVPSLVVKVNDTGVWPHWDRFGAYLQVETHELEAALPGFLTHAHRPTGDYSTARDLFIREFRYLADGGAASRIADAVVNIADGTLQIIGDSPRNA